jgi:PHP family Zn ribbon phosphoesterase
MQCFGTTENYYWDLPVQKGKYDQVTCVDCNKIFELNESELGIELRSYNNNDYLAIL